MRTNHHPKEAFRALVDDLIEGCLEESGRQELQSQLLKDPAARSWYRKMMRVHTLLRLDGQSELLPPVAASRPRTVLSGLAFRKAKWLRVAAVLAATLLLVVYIREPFSGFLNRLVPPGRGLPVATLAASYGGVFHYGADGEPRPDPGTRLPDGVYRLNSGLVEVAYSSGTRLTLAAPAEFELIDDMNLRLVEGRLSAKMGPGVSGFTVYTAGSRAIDLGTVFGVKATSGGDSEIHVFEGAVRLELLDEDGQVLEQVALDAGKATRLNPASGVYSGIAVDSSELLRPLSERDEAYARTVLSLGPSVYYRMEPTGSGDQLHDSSGNGVHSKLIGADNPSPPWGPGRVGSALKLGGPGAGVVAFADNFQQSESKTFSISAWVIAESRPWYASIAKNWGAGQVGQFHFGLFETSGELELQVHDVERLHLPWPEMRQFVRDTETFPLGVWQHVAAVVDDDTLYLYRNGVEVARSGYGCLSDDQSLSILSVGSKLEEESSEPDSRRGVHRGDRLPRHTSMWDGRIDELAVFDHPLTAEEVRLLCDFPSNR